VLTASSIGSAKGAGYARYLESKTVEHARGDYYLSPSGEPTQAPGRWLATPETLAGVGIEGATVDGSDFVALMDGRHPKTGRWLRAAGADRSRAGGIDLTFSAPKSVSAVWALGGEDHRRAVVAAHEAAVDQAMRYLAAAVPTVRRRRGAAIVEERARDLVAAAYLHTTARGAMEGGAPDPQIHSHVVVTAAVRDDGRVVAVASRPLFRAAREVGAFYRSALANDLAERGYAIEAGTGRKGRYFEIAGVPKDLLDAFSSRAREVVRAAERFRAVRGREPERGELRRLKLENRRAKTVVTRGDLQAAWGELAESSSVAGERLDERLARARSLAPELPLVDRVEDRLTERAATFAAGDLRATILEQSVGQLTPLAALESAPGMIAAGWIIPLEGGVFTTRTVRGRERMIEDRFRALVARARRDVGERARVSACAEVAARIGARLSDEQTHALEVISGLERGAVLIGPAGTGKGVVIDSAARAEQIAGNEALGIAVSGSTAQRLGQDCPALTGRTLTLDALIARVDTGAVELGERSTVFFDEAGMADTSRLENLTAVVARAGAKLVVIGDAEQLPSIGPGGMFERLAAIGPSAQLSTVHRTLDRDEQRAWRDLREGRSDRAMARYLAKGRLHVSDSRDEAVERAVESWAALTEVLPVTDVALISDASNTEIARLNARAQHYRAMRGELGEREVNLPGVHYGIRAGDRVATVSQYFVPGERRVENGSLGVVLEVSAVGAALVEFDTHGQLLTLAGEDLAGIRLGYAQHIHRAQGATVNRTLVVTGGWQTSKEPAYVEASRARHGTDWFVSREDLGAEGSDVDRIKRFAANMRRSSRQTPSLELRELREPVTDVGVNLEEVRGRVLPERHRERAR